MRICILTTTHNPFDVRIFQKEAKTLAKDYKVVVIAPNDKNREFIKSNIQVITVKKPKSKILHFLTLWRVFKTGIRHKYDIVHCHEPDSLIIGLLFKFLRGSKVIYDVHEHWPSEIVYGWLKIKHKPILKKIVETLSYLVEIKSSKFADCVIAVSNSVAERFKKNGIDVKILPNVPLMSKITSSKKKDCDVVLVGGGLQEYHGINELLSALANVKNHIPTVTLKIVGNVKVNIEEMLSEFKLSSNTILTGYLNLEKMYSEIQKGKIGVILFKAEFHNAYLGLPNKLFDYMLCGLPVVASDFPEIRRVVSSAKCGILADPNNIKEITDAMLYLFKSPAEAKKMGIRGKRLIEREMNWERMEDILMDVYRNL